MGALIDGLLGRYNGLPEARIPPPPEWLALILHGLTLSRFNRFLAENGFTARRTSGFRNPARNEAVGGVPNSAHVHGLAIDCVPSGISWAHFASAWRAQTGGVAIVEGDHVHLNLPREWGWGIVRGFMLVLGLGVLLSLAFFTKVVSYGKSKKNKSRR